MRILSQDGTIDIPYEIAFIDMCVPCTENGEYKIYAHGSFIGLDADANYIQIAEYYTEEKAKKALEMLHKTYAGLPVIMNNVEVTAEVAEVLKETNKNAIVCQTLNGEPSSVQYVDNGYFQFPEDDEVEV